MSLKLHPKDRATVRPLPSLCCHASGSSTSRLDGIQDLSSFLVVAGFVLEESPSFFVCQRAIISYCKKIAQNRNPRPPGSPYMSLTVPAKPGVAERVPAVCHVDGSSRLQTVTEESSPLYHRQDEMWDGMGWDVFCGRDEAVRDGLRLYGVRW